MMQESVLFVGQLEEEGVEYIFGWPAEENLDFLESFFTPSIPLL
jgi:acetolactate synthase-1/2/3 large subunit